MQDTISNGILLLSFALYEKMMEDEMKKLFAIFVILLTLTFVNGPLAQAVQGDGLWLNEVVGGYASNDGVKVEFHSKVTESQNKGKFIYWYEVKNLGNIKVIVQWELIDRAISGIFKFMYPIRLRPGESKEFMFESNEPPVFFNGRDRVFKEADAHFYESLKRQGVSTSENGLYMFLAGGTHPGFLPEELTKKLE